MLPGGGVNEGIMTIMGTKSFLQYQPYQSNVLQPFKQSTVLYRATR